MYDPVEPIAIIGISCRFPGGAHDLDSLWHLLVQGRNTWTDVPSSRFNGESFSHSSRGTNSAHTHRGGHFLEHDIAAFDAGFFGLSASEAEAMDPQQRIQIEIAYEALENAGITLESVKSSNTSVYVATFTHDYENMMYKDPISLPKYSMTGVGQAIVSNRISFLLDLHGPSITLDTGCSGSLVALHQACQSLKVGESDMALVGGTNLIISPDTMIPMDLLHLLNSQGKCFPFDSRGTGYGRGEGVAMVVIKRLNDAVKAGDPIRAIIRNTAIGQDGKTRGITMPNETAQESLIRSVYSPINLEPGDIDYIEAHGTGTIAGDEKELNALGKTFCTGRKRPLYVGSIKGNVGHLESASGLAGLIKAVLILEKGLIPATPNFETLKPMLNPTAWNIEIPKTTIVWPSNDIRRVSINSFGYGGANAHAVLEEPLIGPYHDDAARHKSSEEACVRKSDHSHYQERAHLFVVSAKSRLSLLHTLDKLRVWAISQDKPASFVTDLAYTLTSRRSLMHWRYSFVASTGQDFLKSLDLKAVRTTRTANHARVIFIFTGQGAQWCRMAKELVESSSVVASSLQRCENILRQSGAQWSLLEELSRDERTSRIHESEIGQPLTTSIQISLVDLLRDLKVNPYAILGHSSGEIAAAYAAGGLTMDSALQISFHRGSLASISRGLLNTQGAMLAVGLPEERVASYLSQLSAGQAVIACSNSPLSTTVSGDEDAIIQLNGLLSQDSIATRMLKVDAAYHSHHMQAVASTYHTKLKGLEAGMPDSSTRLWSSVTAKTSSDLNRDYWVRNLISKVRFCDALQTLCQQIHTESQDASLSAHHIFVELGPHSTLSGAINETIAHLELDLFAHSYVSTLRRNHDSLLSFLHCIGHLSEQGVPVDLQASNSLERKVAYRSVISSLAPYPWDHSTTYWYEPRISKEHRFRPYPYHDLLGLRIPGLTNIEPVWRHILSTETLPWLKDHAVDGVLIFPGAGYITMVIEAEKQNSYERYGSQIIQNYILRDVVFSKLLEIPTPSQGIEVQLSLRLLSSASDGPSRDCKEFRIFSITKDGATAEHCRGYISLEQASKVKRSEASIDDRGAQYVAEIESDRLYNVRAAQNPESETPIIYDELRSQGHHWGSSFAMIKKISLGKHDASGTVMIPDVTRFMPGGFMQPHIMHPTTLDALIHSSLILFARASNRGVMFPVSIGELSISGDIVRSPGDLLDFVTSIEPHSSSSTSMSISAFQNSLSGPRLCLRLRDGKLRGTTDLRKASAGAYGTRELCHQMAWSMDIDLCNPAPSPLLDLIHPRQPITPEDKLELLNNAASLFVNACIGSISEGNVKKQHLEMFKWMKRHWGTEQGDMTARRSDTERAFARSRLVGPEGEALYRIGSNLKYIIAGKVDPLPLLLEDDLLSEVYAEDESFRRCYSHLTNYVQHLVFKDPGLRVIEIGAGTGGGTLPLLQSLDNDKLRGIKSYDFTDVSAGFFENARLKLSRWNELLRFKTLDIGKDPMRQGFVENSYDLVLAFNALHVTDSIQDAVANVRKLLKPRGRLVLIEMTRSMPFINVIFGVLPGWYSGRTDGRRDSPLMSIDEWEHRLVQGSFNGVDFVAKDYNGSAQKAAMIVSKPITNVTKSLAMSRSIATIRVLHRLGTKDHEILEPGLLNLFDAPASQLRFEKLPISEIVPDDTYIILDNTENSLLMDVGQRVSDCIRQLLTMAKKVLWLIFSDVECTQSASGPHLISGLARAARRNNQQLKLITVDIRETMRNGLLDTKFHSLLTKILSESFHDSYAKPAGEIDYIYNCGLILIPRLRSCHRINAWIQQATGSQVQPERFHQNDGVLKLSTKSPGMLNSTNFVHEEVLASHLDSFEVEIRVEAWAVDSEDDFLALGNTKASGKTIAECAGSVVSVGSYFKSQYGPGDRVCAWGSITCANRIRVNGKNVHILPSTMSLAVGATLPIAFLTAYYALIHLASLRQEETILIHAAASSIGKAAVQIAQHVGATIIVTVASALERQDIIKLSSIPEDYIFSSKTPSFQSRTLRLTRGSGVDVVLDLSSGQFLAESIDCIGLFGRLVCTRRSSAQSQFHLYTRLLEKSITFTSIDQAALCEYRPVITGQIMRKVTQLFVEGRLQPISPIMTMPLENIEDVFKQFHDETLIGKVVLEATLDTVVQAIPKKLPTLELEKDRTFVVAGHVNELVLAVCRYLSTRGSTHVLLVSWSKLDPAQEQVLEKELTSLSTASHMVVYDLSERVSSKEALCEIPELWPPVCGIVQVDMAIPSNILQSMDLNGHLDALRAYIRGAQFLSNRFGGPCLDSVLVLSSIDGLSQIAREYTTTMIANPTSMARPKGASLKCVSLNVGGLANSGFLLTNSKVEQDLLCQGFLPIETNELHALLDYAMTKQASGDSYEQIFAGFDTQSMADSENKEGFEHPQFIHMSQLDVRQVDTPAAVLTPVSEETLEDAKTPVDARRIVVSALQHKISTFITADFDMIDVLVPIEDFGLDSLIMFRMRNWTYQNFKADLRPDEISDAKSIVELSAAILERTSYTTWRQEKETSISHPIQAVAKTTPQGDRISFQHTTTIPLQPLQPLENSLESFLDAIQSICSEDEFEKASSAVKDFDIAGGIGRKLHERLVRRAEDPNVENWLGDFYAARRYLRLRASLVACQTYFGSHPLSRKPESSAERATLITTTTFEFMQKLQSGKLERQYVGGQMIDPETYGGLFESCREPHIGEDVIRKYPRSDHIVVFRYGHAFKVVLRQDSKLITPGLLRATYEKILQSTLEDIQWTSILTTDERDRWAEIRAGLIQFSDKNKNSLQAIESAAFIVCLDHGCPRTTVERFQQFLFSDGSNRWYDKTLQFVVCDNGVSASVMEHATLDGIAVEPIHRYLNEAIISYNPKTTSTMDEKTSEAHTIIEKLTIQAHPAANKLFMELRQNLKARTSKYSFAALEVTTLSRTFLQFHKCANQSGIQVAIQLASRLFFGYSPPALETVSMSHFRKGRVEVNHPVRPPLIEFLDAATSDSPPQNNVLRQFFYNAAKSHAISLSRASKGRGFSRHLLAMEWMLQEGEQAPTLFSESAYARSKAGEVKLLTSCFTTGWLEGGFVYPVPGGVLVYFEIKDQSVNFSVFGNDTEAARFGELLKDAAQSIHDILDETRSQQV